jgi:hypothetical protein
MIRSASGKWKLLGGRKATKGGEDGEWESPLLMWDETEIAKQLCLIDFEFMRVRFGCERLHVGAERYR